jgi:hypothetical protein
MDRNLDHTPINIVMRKEFKSFKSSYLSSFFSGGIEAEMYVLAVVYHHGSPTIADLLHSANPALAVGTLTVFLVLLAGSKSQVDRVYAGRIVTNVVNLHIGWDRSMFELISDSVSQQVSEATISPEASSRCP